MILLPSLLLRAQLRCTKCKAQTTHYRTWTDQLIKELQILNLTCLPTSPSERKVGPALLRNPLTFLNGPLLPIDTPRAALQNRLFTSKNIAAFSNQIYLSIQAPTNCVAAFLLLALTQEVNTSWVRARSKVQVFTYFLLHSVSEK